MCPDRAAAAGHPHVSVIVPVYNVQPYLRQCLDSLVAQDFDSYEIVAVDDGSTDDSPAILREYAAAHPDLIVTHTKTNGGLSDARNAGIGLARGDYLAFVDGDDIADHSMLRLAYEKAACTDADIVVFGYYTYFGQTGRAHPKRSSMPSAYNVSLADHPEILADLPPYAWNKLYRRELFEHLTFPNGWIFEDIGTTLPLLAFANEIALVNTPLYYYRVDRPSSITQKFDDHFYDLFLSIDRAFDFFDRLGLTDKVREPMAIQIRQRFFLRLDALRMSPDHDAACRYVDALYAYLRRRAPGWWRKPAYLHSLTDPRFLTQPSRRGFLTAAGMKRSLRRWWAAHPQPASPGVPVEPYTQLFHELQQETLELLIRFDAIARENHLTYYLLGGSLLGAIRDHGFIPWDEDLDVSLPRADYQRLIEIMGANETNGCLLFNETTDPHYSLTFTKIVSAGESAFTNSRIAMPPRFDKPFLDVFPLDAGVPQESRRRIAQISRWQTILYLQGGRLHRWQDKLRRNVWWPISALIPIRVTRKRLQRLYRHWEGRPQATRLVNFASSYALTRETFDPSDYGEPRLVEFEGHLFPVPQKAENVLRTVFGDYLSLPPEPQRVSGLHTPRWHPPS